MTDRTTQPVKTRKKLIEVALPLDAINVASAREKSIRQGHPSTLHLWWARRPLAAARAVIFAQMVDDPSEHPDLFPTEKSQEKERLRLFRIIEELVIWSSTTNENVLRRARDEIWQSWRRTCTANVDHPLAEVLFDRCKLPAFHDPFAGGGTLPLEAQRLGLESYASDLNPVAVLINKAMIEIPPKFAGRPPVNPEARSDPNLFARKWMGAQGLAADLRYYAQWLSDEAEKQIGQLYPTVKITAEMAKSRPDLGPYVGRGLTVISWLWARTVKSPNPAFSDVDVPLASTFMLSSKAGKEAFVAPEIDGRQYRFVVTVDTPEDTVATKRGTKLARGANFKCLMSDSPIAGDYIKAEGIAGRIGTRLMAVVVEGEGQRVYLSPTPQDEETARAASPTWRPAEPLPAEDTANFWCTLYGLANYGDLFTDRQLVALTKFSDLVATTVERVNRDARASSVSDDDPTFSDEGKSSTAYAEALAAYLSMCLSRQANRASTLNFWDTKGENIQQVFARQALPMTWDFVEGNPFSNSTGNFVGQADYMARVLEVSVPACPGGHVTQDDAQNQSLSFNKIVSTDPPYYDNIGYADLSDFFYVWLRRSMRPVSPDLFATLAVPKSEELVATPFRHGGPTPAKAFFLDGMTHAMRRLSEQAHPAFPVTIYYAFKQSESASDLGTASTGWETFLEAVTQAGFSTTGTWPVRTEYTGNLKKNISALASSVVLVCRKRSADAPDATLREFVNVLKTEVPLALAHLKGSNIAPVDLAQAAIGPGMAVYTRYRKVLDAKGRSLSVREALALINQTLDEALTAEEGEFDSDTQWAVAWFEQWGFTDGDYGLAESLSKAKNISVQGLVQSGILKSSRGQVRLLSPTELDTEWDPATDPRLTFWEIVHHLVRCLDSGGEAAAAEIIVKLGRRSEGTRELAYRLYNISERKKRVPEALAYNGLVQSWPEIERLASTASGADPAQQDMFTQE
jgi:putative DNA methylase